MALLKFRIYWQEDESIYRDIIIQHAQSFFELHEGILKSFEFDNKHSATFYRSNDAWQKGREISLEKYDKPYRVEPLIMADVVLGSEIKDPNQKFFYEYDFNKHWHFLVELIQVDKSSAEGIAYPMCIRTEGMAPSQYGAKGLVDKRLAEMEDKYDLKPTAMDDGFGQEGEESDEDVEESSEESIDDDL